MEKNTLYLILLMALGFFSTSCNDEATNPFGTGTGPGEDKADALYSISTVVSSFATNSRAPQVHQDDPTATGFYVRTELGQKMTVTLGENTDNYIYRNSRWYPANEPLLYTNTDSTTSISISIKTDETEAQDGSAEGLIKADDLIALGEFPFMRHIDYVPMAHAKALVELDLGFYPPSGNVTINNRDIAYQIPNTNKYQAIIESGTEKFNVTLNFNNRDFDFEIKASDLSNADMFVLNTIYRVPLALKKGDMTFEIGNNIVIENWDDFLINGQAVKMIFPTSFFVQGWENRTATVRYTNGDEAQFTFNAEGKGEAPSETPARLVKSIEIEKDGKTQLVRIGIEEGNEINFIINDTGRIDWRRNVDDKILIGIAEELFTSFQKDVNGVLTDFANTDSIIQERDIDLMNELMTPKGSPDASYDGQNYKLHHININQTSNYAALFATKKGIIKNVHITSGTIQGGQYTAGIVGNAMGKVINCTNAATISGTTYVGGIAGNIQHNIINCINTGNITATGNNIGGIAGTTASTNNVLFTGCINKGNISTTGSYAGGIVAYAYSGMQGITACYNTGNIEASDFCGGITARMRVISTNNIVKITASYNTGTITGTTNSGGIIGGMFATGTSIASGVTNCYWTGHIAAGADLTTANAQQFSATVWPANDAAKNWGIGTSGTNGYFWKDLGGYNSGNSVYPQLYWE